MACATAEEAPQELGDQYDAGGSTVGGSSPVGGGETTGGSAISKAGTATSGSSAGGGSSGSSATAGAGGTTVGGAGGTGGSSGGAGGAGGAGGTGGAVGNDLCPTDPNKTAPGKCGCGASDVDSASGASCIPLQNSLVHRYSFEGDAKDSIGSAHGALVGGASINGGALNLAGAKSGQYLNLPNALISSLSSATIEAYVTWTGAADGDWQRVFDFGSSNMAEDMQGTGNKYLFLSARKLRACYTNASPSAEIFSDSTTDLSSEPTQLAVVVDGNAHTLQVFVDGNPTGNSASLSLPLSAINDVNNWLGRSQFAADDYFGGKISEFRIYNAALSGPQLKTSKAMGENTSYLKK